MTVKNKNFPLKKLMLLGDVRNTKNITVDGFAGNSSLPRGISCPELPPGMGAYQSQGANARAHGRGWRATNTGCGYVPPTRASPMLLLQFESSLPATSSQVTEQQSMRPLHSSALHATGADPPGMNMHLYYPSKKNADKVTKKLCYC